MRRNTHQLALAAVSLLCIFGLAACGSNTPVLRYVTVAPTSATISVSTTQQFTATAFFSNGTSSDATALVSWTSSNTAVATIALGGVATAVGPGTTTISAALSGITSSSATLSVSQLTSIAVSPATATIAIGGTQNYTALGTFKNPDGTTGTSDVTSLATWNSGTPAVATLSNTGNTPVIATGVATGTTMITASLNGVTSPAANLVVGPPVAVSLQLTPATQTIAIGNTITFTAQELFSDGTLHPLSGTVTWSSGTTATATILGTSGIAVAMAAGTSTITGTEGTLTGTATLSVVAGTAHFAYIANANDFDIQWYAVSTTTSPYLTGPAADNTGATGWEPAQVLVHPSGNFLYAITFFSSGNEDVYIYSIAPLTSTTPGALTPTNATSPVVAGTETGTTASTPFGVIDPYGRFLYVADLANSTIYGFQISQTDGTLTAIQGAAPFTDTNLSGPTSLVIDHSGTYLYAINSGSSMVSIYTIDNTATATAGALTPLASQPTVATDVLPQGATIDPTGTYLYVANQGAAAGAGTVSAYSIDYTSAATAGQLTPLAGSPYTIGSGAAGDTNSDVWSVLVDPSGKYLYVLDAGAQVFTYNLSAGALTTQVGTTSAATGLTPLSFALDPTGSLLATANNTDSPGSLSIFPVSAGVLGTVATVNSDGIPVASQNSTGSAPVWITFYNAP
jgi:6-phosphogluconolactonase (cycloisomerase 2 family)